MTAYAGATVAGFTQYQTERGRDLPGTWDSEHIGAALLVASEWIDHVYGSVFVGQKTAGFLQEREWPRINATVYDSKGRTSYTFPNDVIPAAIVNAVYEATYRQAVTPGSLMVDYKPGKYKRVSVDTLSVEYTHFSFAAQTQATFPIIDSILLPLFDIHAASNSIYSGAINRV